MALGQIIGRITNPSAKMTGSAAILGNALKYGTNHQEVALATAATDIPAGVAAEAVAQNSNVGVILPGVLCTGLASAAISKGVLVGATTSGKFVTVTKGGTQTETNYCWGSSWSAAGADLDYFELAFNWFEVETA